MKNTVIAIIGPTAVGKTKLSIDMAKQFNGEIISGDSMQVYRGMDIGTAKVTKAEQQNIPHYMIDIKAPNEPFTTADFQRKVRRHIDTISNKDKLPIIVGGSGLYVQSALYEYNFSIGKRDEKTTKNLEQFRDENGIMPLYEKLQKIDPEQAKNIHPNNHRRIIRAIEVYETTGKTLTQLQQDQTTTSLYNSILIGLDMDRELLYSRINDRVDQMIEIGLIEEVRHLYEQGFENTQAMRGIGYKELIPYIKNKSSLDECIELLKRNSRRFAKRQYTWFKNKMDVQWYTITPESYNEVFPVIYSDIKDLI